MFNPAATDLSASATLFDVVMPVTQGLESTAFVAGRMSDPWQGCLSDLEALLGLQDDWDGEGSAAPDAANVRSAMRLLETTYRSGNFPAPPQASPGGNGEVVLTWREGDQYLEAELVTPGKVEWMLAGSGRQNTHWVTELPAGMKNERTEKRNGADKILIGSRNCQPPDG